MRSYQTLLLTACLVLACSCSGANDLPPIKPVAHVDLPRFMGDWYVIATIPTRFEKNAYNPLETYKLLPDGRVDTGFRFRDGGFDRKVKAIRSTGVVKPGSGNAVWGVQVFWPIKAQYIVAYLKDDYSQTIVARDARDYTWVMARTPTVSPADYANLMSHLKAMGYPLDQVRKVPQRWPETSK